LKLWLSFAVSRFWYKWHTSYCSQVFEKTMKKKLTTQSARDGVVEVLWRSIVEKNTLSYLQFHFSLTFQCSSSIIRKVNSIHSKQFWRKPRPKVMNEIEFASWTVFFSFVFRLPL
jgi:hypothetical protein